LPRLGVCGRQSSTEIVSPAQQNSLHHWQFSKVHTGSRFAHGFQSSVRMIIKQNFAGNKHKSYQIMKMQMFATLDKANPDTEIIRGLNFMWDLWWIKWNWGMFSPSTSVSPANSHSTDCSTTIIICHLGLVQ
jgi:hypothetical protein